MNWKEYFYYKEGNLFWSKDIGYKIKRGKEAGCINTKGYKLVGLNRKTYKVHRIIYEMFNGEIPAGKQVDHIDRNKNNNKIENLRIVTDQQNKFNRGINKNNTSGHRGVHWNVKSQKWQSRIQVGGRCIHLGYFKNNLEAIQAYREAELRYHSFDI